MRSPAHGEQMGLDAAAAMAQQAAAIALQEHKHTALASQPMPYIRPPHVDGQLCAVTAPYPVAPAENNN